MRVYSYRSQLIRPCAYVDGAHAGRWYVQSYHAPTSMRWEDSVCAHHRTLRDARQAIREEDAEKSDESPQAEGW